MINMQAPGAAAVLPKLHTLRLECWNWQGALWDNHVTPPYVEDVPLTKLPASIASSLAPATALTALELHSLWDTDVPALVRSLPALRRLCLEVMECTEENAADAVDLLAELPAGAEVAMSVHSHWSGEAYHDYPDLDAWEHEVPLPPMGAIAATVTSLELVGIAGLPPDWRQLTGLQTLRLLHNLLEQPFGVAPLTALTTLKTVRFDRSELPSPDLLATAPALETVSTVAIPHAILGEWRAQLQALRPDVVITCADL